MIRISKTIGFRGLAYFQTHPYVFPFFFIADKCPIRPSTSGPPCPGTVRQQKGGALPGEMLG